MNIRTSHKVFTKRDISILKQQAKTIRKNTDSTHTEALRDLAIAEAFSSWDEIVHAHNQFLELKHIFFYNCIIASASPALTTDLERIKAPHIVRRISEFSTERTLNEYSENELQYFILDANISGYMGIWVYGYMGIWVYGDLITATAESQAAA